MRPTLLLRLSLAALLLCLATFPDPLLAARLSLRVQGTESSAATALVGDVLDVEVWVDSESATLSGAAVFLTYDGEVFELVDQDRDVATGGFQPFEPGLFLRNGEIFRNAWLDPDDPAASPSGEQLDYSVVRAADSGAGPVATFRLRALAPAAGASIRIDESGIRETRYFRPDGSHQAFRFITPLTVDVRGITIEGAPSQLVLARGQVDSTTFALDDLLFDPVYGPQEIQWHVDATSAVDARIDATTRRLVIAAPTDRSLWEQLTLRAVNPDGQTTAAVIDLFVNAGPAIAAAPDTLDVTEDEGLRLGLDDLVEDPDSPDAQLLWSLFAPANMGARLEGPPHELVLEPTADWTGEGQIVLATEDRFGFTDTARVHVRVWPINDPPRSLFAPNLRVTRGKSDASLHVADLFADVDDDLAALPLTWTGAERVQLERLDGRLVVRAPSDWEGTEVIQLTLTDAAGETATAPLTVTVVASLAPAISGAPGRLGVAAGETAVLDLTQFVTDPDDAVSDLTWSAVGHSRLLVQVSTSGAVRIEAPGDFSGMETLRLSAADPSGESAAFDLLVFSAPAGGEPLVAPLPAISVPRNGANATLDLDEYVFDLDHDPSQITWTAEAPPGLQLRIDGATHVLTVLADDTLVGDVLIDITATDPDGHQRTASLAVTVTVDPIVVDPTDPVDPVDPVDPGSRTGDIALAALPTVRVTESGFDRSLRLDSYVESGDLSGLVWQAEANDHVQVMVDGATRQVTVLAGDGWTGPLLVTLRAWDGTGALVVETFLGIQVEAAVAALSLADLTEVPVLQGDSLVAIEAASLLLEGPAPQELTWSASGARSYSLTVDGTRLLLHSDGFTTPGSEVVTLVARDAAGNTAAGTLLLQVLPLDGSVGQERDSFRVTLLPNPIHPAYLDLYVIDDEVTDEAPRLRSLAGDWVETPLTAVTEGIWQASHTLSADADGALTFLALRFDGQQLTRADRQIFVGAAPATSGKRLSAGPVQIEWDAGAVEGAQAVVAVIPESAAATAELRPAGAALRLHATGALRGTPRLRMPAADPRAHLYRWDDSAQHWTFVGGRHEAGDLHVAVDRLGRYALMADEVAPHFTSLGDGRLRVTDGGSGVDAVEALLDGVPLPGALARDADGLWRWTEDAPADAEIGVRVTDRAGNRHIERLAVASPLPTSVQLGQNFPNPFNPETTIPVRVAVAGKVRVEIYNAAGQHVRTLVEAVLPGETHLTWDGRDAAGRAVSSGTYLYRAITRAAETGDAVQTRRMTLLR
jgi:hypothetical protein